MARAPRMKDVAEAAGVSPMTVSRAFRSDSAISQATRDRIVRIAGELGYVFDSTAATLRSKRTGFVAVTVPSLNNANFADTVGALSAKLSAHGLQILLGHTGYSVAAEEALIAEFLPRRPEAIVLTGGDHTDAARHMLARAAIPVVETWDMPDRPLDRVVGFSNAAAMEQMVTHLAAQGLTRIGILGGENPADSRGSARREGTLTAMRRRGLDTHRLSPAGHPPVSMTEGARAMAHHLDAFPDTEAAICVSDLIAFGAMAECQRRGIAVPDTIAIAGFGNYEISTVAVPEITTIEAGAVEIGEETAALLTALLRTGQPARDLIRTQPRLIPRASTRRRQ